MSCINIPNPFSKGAPDAPDYMGAANMQTRANRPNQNTPWASSTWSPQTVSSGPQALRRGGESLQFGGSSGPAGDGTLQQHISLSPQLDQANQSMMGQLSGAWANPLSDGSDARKAATDAIYGQATSRLDPQWQQRQHDMDVQLSQQGIDPSSAAYAKQLDNFGRGRTDAYNQALQSAIMGGGNAAQQQQQMDLASRFAPLQGMGGLQGLSGMPNPGQAGNYLGAAGLQGQYGLDAQAMNNKFYADLMKKVPLPGMGGGGGGGGGG